MFVSTGSGWSWSGVTATILDSKSSAVTELRISKSDFSSLASTIRVAYGDLVNWVFASKLPASGGYASYTLQSVPSFGGITIDGASADWSSISSVATASGITLKVYDNSNTVYLAALGSLNNAYQFFIDADNNASTGFQDGSWSSSGVDYMIENGTLYQHAGGGWSWTLIGTVSAVHNASLTELAISKSSLSSLSGTFRVGYKDLQTWTVMATVPGSGSLASYTTGSGLRQADQGVEILAKSMVSIYPNPTITDVLQVNDAFGEGFTALALYTASGGLVLRQEVNSDRETIDVNHLVKGIYILNLLKADGQTRHFKVLK